jgi:hypothetical protein
MATGTRVGSLPTMRPSRRSFLLGLGAVAAIPALEACSIGKPGPMLELYGRNGSFGALTGKTRLPGGQSFANVSVRNWGFGAGQAAYMSAVTGAGAVVIGTTPYTDNQMEPTAKTMELGVLLPGTRSFQRIVVPSTTNQTQLVANGSRYGGGDIGDVQVVGQGVNERVLFVSVMPYHGWNVATDGQLPSFGALRPAGGGSLVVDSRGDRTAQAMVASMPGMQMPQYNNSYGQTIVNGRGLCEMALLPASGDVVVTQYFGPSQLNQQGGILVLDQQGRIKASWQYPPVTTARGPIKCLVREVESDPTGRLGDERFAIICDAFDSNDNPVPFPLQEFSYNALSGVIRPVSAPIQASADGIRNETAKYGNDGTLYVARTRSDGLTAGQVAVYRKGHIASHAPATGAWTTTAWNTVLPPDQFVRGTETTGLVRSLSVDPLTGAVLVAGLSGILQALTGPIGRVTVRSSVDIGLNHLVDRTTHNVGVRKGAVDASRRALWLPVPQLDMRAPYPSNYPTLDQWVYRVDLRQLLGA